MSDVKQGGDWPILRLPVDHGDVYPATRSMGDCGSPMEAVAQGVSDPCEPGITVVALGDGINECKGAGVHDAKADRVLCMPTGESSR